MLRKQYQSSFVRWAISQGWLEGTDMSLIDVGASGGIEPFWQQFRPYLRAVGFDPLASEVDRLNSAENDPKIEYVAAWVGNGIQQGGPEGRTLHSFTSAQRAADLKRMSYTQTYFNAGQELVYTDNTTTVDQFALARGLNSFDAIKIDTDGFDYFVLEGARHLLFDGQLLFVECECQFHEPVGSKWPVFADIDRYMREAGYRLVDLDPWRYTRSTLPGKFMFDIQAQTVGGQIGFCDALYALDLSVDQTAFIRLAGSPEKLVKLVLLQAAFGYGDLAASTLIAMREVGTVPDCIDVDAALDFLVPANPFGATSYREYIGIFERDPDQFLQSDWERLEGSKPRLRDWLASTAESYEDDWLPHMSPGSAGSKKGPLIEAKTGVAGHVAYGPYARLPVGSYELTVKFEDDPASSRVSDPEAQSPPAEINIEVVAGGVALKNMRLKGDEVATSVRKLKLELGAELAETVLAHGVEVRIFSNGSRGFSISKVRIARLTKGNIPQD